MYSDSGFTNWVQYQYAEKMFDFEVGRIFNIRIMTSTLVPTSSSSAQGAALTAFTPSSVSNIAYAMTIFGKDAYGVKYCAPYVKIYGNKSGYIGKNLYEKIPREPVRDTVTTTRQTPIREMI